MTAQAASVSERGADRATRELVRALAARCRGRTAVVGTGRALVEAVEQRGLEAVGIEPWHAVERLDGETFRTVLLTHTIERVDEEEGTRLIRQAWAAVGAGGRLLVVVPNEEMGRDGEQRRTFDRKALKRSLAQLGKPRICGDQPYRWLAMYVERPREGGHKPNRTRRARYRATARLCRGRVVELGCGEGHLARMIHERGHEVVGVDLAAGKIAEACRLHPGIRFMRCDIRDVDLPDEHFDTVILAEVLEHVDDEVGGEILVRAWRLLAPGGRLIVSVPNEHMIPHPNHVREFDRRSLRRLLEPLGRPRTVDEQPYKWLMLYVEKAR
jgi:SAM-dependent methyltransferase